MRSFKFVILCTGIFSIGLFWLLQISDYEYFVSIEPHSLLNASVSNKKGLNFSNPLEKRYDKKILADSERENEDDGSFKQEGAFRLVFGFLIREKPLQALEVIEEKNLKGAAALAARCFAAFELDSFSETVYLFNDLPEPYKSLDGFRGIAIESLTAIGDIIRAESMLNKLLKSPPEPSNDQFPAYFLAFKKKRLDHWNRYYVAGIFYKIVKNDLDQALGYFQKIRTFSPAAEIEKAEIYQLQGRYHEAQEILKAVLEKIQGNEEEDKIKLRLYPLLGLMTSEIGYYPEALEYYRAYFTLDSPDERIRVPFARALMAVMRYDLGLEQFQQYRKSFSLSPQEMVEMIECVVRTGDFKRANQMVHRWIVSGKAPLADQLKLGQLMMITRNSDLIETIVAAISKKETLNAKEKIQLILFWLDLGNYQQALALASVNQRVLEGSVDGLMALVELNKRLSKYEEALNFAEIASRIVPGDPRVANFLEQYERSPLTIAKSVKLLQERLESVPSNLTVEMNLYSDLIDLAVEAYSTGVIEDLSQSSDLHRAKSGLEKMTKEQKDLPKPFFLLGKAYYLLDLDDAAKTALTTALNLNVSYVDAYQYLALLLEENNDLSQAEEVIKKAVTFAPSSSDVWRQLGQILMRQGAPEDAIGPFKNAKKFAPRAIEPFRDLAQAYLAQNNPDFAIATLEDALKLYPRDLETIRLMLLALYDKGYETKTLDKMDLEKRRIRFFDKLEALDSKEAQALRDQFGIEKE